MLASKDTLASHCTSKVLSPGRTLRAEAEKADEALDRIIQIRFLPEAVPQPSAFLPVEPACGFCQFTGSRWETSGRFCHFHPWTVLAVHPTQQVAPTSRYMSSNPKPKHIKMLKMTMTNKTSLFRGERQTTDILFGQCNHPLHCSVSDIPQPPQERNRNSFVYAGMQLTSIWCLCL